MSKIFVLLWSGVLRGNWESKLLGTITTSIEWEQVSVGNPPNLFPDLKVTPPLEKGIEL